MNEPVARDSNVTKVLERLLKGKLVKNTNNLQ